MNAITEDILESIYDMVFHPYRIVYGYFPKEVSRKSALVAIHRLYKKGYVKKGIIEDEICIKLTELGFDKLLQMRQVRKEKTIFQINPISDKWDGKWRVAVFDIPEQNRRIRQALRMGLRMLEFKPLQKSVWISKINCTKELRDYINSLDLSDYVLVFETKDLGLQK